MEEHSLFFQQIQILSAQILGQSPVYSQLAEHLE